MSRINTAPSHTQTAFNIYSMPLIVRWAEEICYSVKADAIVACGHSGLVVAGALSYVTRIPVFAVRKRGERDQAVASGNEVTAVADAPAQRWIWLDDFLSSGGTLRRSIKRLQEARVVVSPFPAAVLSYKKYKKGSGWGSAEDFIPRAGGDLGLGELTGEGVILTNVEIPELIPHFGYETP